MAGKIFINYRRGDDPGFTGRLFDRLEDHFPAGQLFMDVDSIEPGLDFVTVLDEQVSSCEVVLAVIGRGWLDATDKSGARRLDNPEDFVRIELESALGRGIRVIPVLVNNAEMPREQDLPDTLRPFARRNAVRLSHEQFRADTAGLIKSLEQALVEEAERRRAMPAIQAETAAPQNDAAAERVRIREAEEEASWEHAQNSKNEYDLRDHLARFQQGKTAPAAKETLATLIWTRRGRWADVQEIEDFLSEFADSQVAARAAARRTAQKVTDRWARISDWYAMLVIPVLLVMSWIFEARRLIWLGGDPLLGYTGGLETGLALGGIAILAGAAIMMLLRRSQLTGEETLSYWLACAFALSLTVLASRFIVNFIPEWDWLLTSRAISSTQILTLPIVALSPLPLVLTRVWPLNAMTISTWWLGIIAALTGYDFVADARVAMIWSDIGLTIPWWEVGLLGKHEAWTTAAVAVVSAALLAIWRRQTVGGTAIANYWLGLVLAFVPPAVFTFQYYAPASGNWLSGLLDTGLVVDAGMGFSLLVIAAALSSAALVYWTRAGVQAMRRYWLGSTVAFMLLMGHLFEYHGLLWLAPTETHRLYELRGYATGGLIAFVVALMAAWLIERLYGSRPSRA